MVRIADLIRVRPKPPKWQSWQNRIHAKHIDFVLCDPETMEAKLAIELDDASHNRRDRVERDKFVDGALSAAGVSAAAGSSGASAVASAVSAGAASDVGALRCHSL